MLAPLIVSATLFPFNIGVVGFHSALLIGSIPSLVCALVTYMFVTSRAKAKILTQPA